MTAKELCAVQDPLKAQYAARPETALARLTATAVLGRDITCTNTIGSVPIRTGMHQGVGGDQPIYVLPPSFTTPWLHARALSWARSQRIWA
jgi:hypothetical protein